MENNQPALDIKCVSFGRVGTIAVNTALNRHARLNVPSWSVAYEHMLSKAQIPDLFLSEADQKSCLMVHHHELFFPKHQPVLDKVIKEPAHRLVHLVRDPVRHVIGWYNHIVTSMLLGQFGWQSCPERVEDFLAANNAILPTLQNENNARLFYPSAEEVMLVEFNQLNNTNFVETINKIQAFCGVEEQPAPYTEVQNDLTTTMLHRGMTFNLNGESVSFKMKQESSASTTLRDDHFMVLDGVGEMMARLAPSTRAIEGKVYIGFAQETELKKSTYDIIQQHRDEIFGPAIEGWVKNAEKFAVQINERKITTLSASQQSVLWRLIGEDVKAFVKRYPKLRDIWQMT